MDFDWPNLAVGVILGIIGDWQIGARLREFSLHRKLKREYSGLAGDYVNFRVKDNGQEEPTGGKIKLIWQRDGSLKAKGLHATGDVEWESDIRMSLEFKGTGIGHFRYTGAAHYGTQQITHIPGARYFGVMGTITSRTGAAPFIHRWKRIAS